KHLTTNKDIRTELSTIADIERILGRVGLGSSNARELNALKDGLTQISSVVSKFAQIKDTPERLKFILHTASEAVEVEQAIQLIDESIESDPPIAITEGKIIKASANEEVAKL